MKRPHSFCHYSQCVHVQSAVCFVEYGQCRVKHCHLEYLVTFLLTAGKSDIDLSLGKLRTHLDECHLLSHKFKEVTAFDRVLTICLAFGVDGGFHEVGDGHARYFDRILERHEDAGP